MNLVNIVEKTYLNQNANIPDNQKLLDSDINQIVNALNNLIYPVGTYYETSDVTFNPNVSWGGTWVKDSEGRVTVSQKVGDSDFGTVGNTDGEKTHTLTIEEMPAHTHTLVYFGNNKPINLNAGGSSYHVNFDQTGTNEEQVGGRSVGGNKPHNNLQPYIVVIRWHRTA